MLGYEGYVKLDGYYLLGTGASAPLARPRLDSTSGYGGRISLPKEEIGIGSPHIYDYVMWDGSVDFEVTKDIWVNTLVAWPFDRQGSREVQFTTRADALQKFDKVWFNSISVSAAEASAVQCSLGFTAYEMTEYNFGDASPQGYVDNKTGETTGIACPGDQFWPGFLNPDQNQSVPVPFWNTQWTQDYAEKDFLDWRLDISQPVETFFGCEVNTNSQEPLFLAVGPMEVKMSGTVMEDLSTDSNRMALVVGMKEREGGDEFIMRGYDTGAREVELQSAADDLQTGSSFTPQAVEFMCWEIDFA
jgi:hypothetical protein